jgi:hypothetical protein
VIGSIFSIVVIPKNPVGLPSTAHVMGIRLSCPMGTRLRSNNWRDGRPNLTRSPEAAYQGEPECEDARVFV